MIAWLGDWLRDIIAVILLAVLAELMLPGKAMLRYVRLVVGLFILLTLLSPILRLFQEDIGDRLDAGMELWDERTMEKEVKMPSLAEIQRRAGELSERRSQEAAQLTERSLEENMMSELGKSTGLQVESVDVELQWNGQPGSGGQPDIAGVLITLKAPENNAQSDGDSAIEAVQPVDVRVELEEDATAAERQSGSADQDTIFASASPSAADALLQALNQGWGVRSDLVLVRQRTAS